jgi:2-C-methyl-D-erythritol 2,4-cyclodiphosphate synthase
MSFRVGHGYDVHRLVPGRKLILGGVDIPYNLGLDGHSDADVLLHAVCDSLLGAAAMRDIGYHFPDSDDSYKGIESVKLLIKVNEMLKEAGYGIVNIDATVIAQKPKLAPYIPDMIKNISEALSVDISSVNVKATTEERLGFTGRGEGISAHAVCIIEK